MAETKISSIERITLWVGALSGIIVSIFTIWNFLIKKDPPDLDVVFALTNTHELIVAPSVKSRKSDWSEEFPVGLKVFNSGEEAATGVKLQIIGARNLRFIAAGIKIEPQIIFSEKGVDLAMHEIELGDINPGTPYRLDNKIYAKAENTMDMEVDVTLQDGNTVIFPVTMVVKHDLKARISALNMPQKEISLNLILGNIDNLSKHKHYSIIL